MKKWKVPDKQSPGVSSLISSNKNIASFVIFISFIGIATWSVTTYVTKGESPEKKNGSLTTYSPMDTHHPETGIHHKIVLSFISNTTKLFFHSL